MLEATDDFVKITEIPSQNKLKFLLFAKSFLKLTRTHIHNVNTHLHTLLTWWAIAPVRVLFRICLCMSSYVKQIGGVGVISWICQLKFYARISVIYTLDQIEI